jgi:hypothetical protein
MAAWIRPGKKYILYFPNDLFSFHVLASLYIFNALAKNIQGLVDILI